MPNPPLPLPATTIQAAWGQAVTTRVVNVYQDAATRDAALPTPEDGQLAWLIDEDVLTVRIAGVLWVKAGVGTFVQVEGDTMDGPLEAKDVVTIRGATGDHRARLDLLGDDANGVCEIRFGQSGGSPVRRILVNPNTGAMTFYKWDGSTFFMEYDQVSQEVKFSEAPRISSIDDSTVGIEPLGISASGKIVRMV